MSEVATTNLASETAETTQSNAEPVESLNLAPEPVVEQEPEDNFEDVLELINEPDEGEGKSTPAPAGETAPPPKPKTQEELEAEIEQKVVSKKASEEAVRQRQRAIEGMRASFRQMDADLRASLNELGITDADGQKKIFDRIQQHNGHWGELYQNDVQASHSAGVDGVRTGIIQAVATVAGKDEAEALINANHQSWDAYLEDFGERYAKKKGYIPPTEAKKLKSAATTETLRKLAKLGVPIPRGGEAKSIGANRAGSSSSASYEQILKNPSKALQMSDEEFLAMIEKG